MIVNVYIEFASKGLIRIIFKKLEINFGEVSQNTCITDRMQNFLKLTG
jgi:hypothetical protein